MNLIKSLKHDYVWHKITEMIEHDVKNDLNEEYEIDDWEKVNVCSQLAFWMSFLQNFSSTGEISSFKYFIYILLVIPAHTLDWKECSKIKSDEIENQKSFEQKANEDADDDYQFHR